jgi:hypothetical protein
VFASPAETGSAWAGRLQRCAHFPSIEAAGQGRIHPHLDIAAHLERRRL